MFLTSVIIVITTVISTFTAFFATYIIRSNCRFLIEFIHFTIKTAFSTISIVSFISTEVIFSTLWTFSSSWSIALWSFTSSWSVALWSFTSSWSVALWSFASSWSVTLWSFTSYWSVTLWSFTSYWLFNLWTFHWSIFLLWLTCHYKFILVRCSFTNWTHCTFSHWTWFDNGMLFLFWSTFTSWRTTIWSYSTSFAIWSCTWFSLLTIWTTWTSLRLFTILSIKYSSNAGFFLWTLFCFTFYCWFFSFWSFFLWFFSFWSWFWFSFLTKIFAHHILCCIFYTTLCRFYFIFRSF